MSTLEQEIIEKFQLLDEEAKKRVRTIIQQTDFDLENWLNQVHQFRESLKTQNTIDAVAMIRQIREEE